MSYYVAVVQIVVTFATFIVALFKLVDTILSIGTRLDIKSKEI